MSLRKKFAENVFPIMMAVGGTIAGSVGYQVLDHDWDDQRGDSADQIVSVFGNALDDLSKLKQENVQLSIDQKVSLLNWDLASNHGQKYQENLGELSKRSTEYAKLMLATPDISERDFESLATQFNDIGLSNFSDIKVDPENADGLKECQLKYYSPNADSTMHSDISGCMNDKEKFGLAPAFGLMGGMMTVLFLLMIGAEDSKTLDKWRNLPDKPKPKKGTSGEKLGARLKRRAGFGPKRPQN